jgi:hypothetical protein
MNFLSNPIVARLLWTMPLLLLVISVSLFRAGLEQREVAQAGTEVSAEIIAIETQERSEISRGHVVLRYMPPAGGEVVERQVELPMTFLKDLELDPEQRQVMIRVLDDRGQVVLADHMRGQWIMTLSFAAMALMGALGFGFMVAAWNRFLAQHGDPAAAGG